MNNTVNYKTNGVEYSDYYRNLRKEVSEQNEKTSLIEPKLFGVEKRTSDKFEFNTVQAGLEKRIFDENDAANVLSMLNFVIRQDPNSAFNAQGNISASRVAVLLEE
ncbi:MAG: hypothetical protein FWF51_00570 [Chitinivibrionia bacterium]|jgi:hypothetical protein|nr:hypothetical protein [Chitinivibrionia bacterium]